MFISKYALTCWDSLGEFLALAASLEHLARTYDNSAAQLLASTLDEAIAKFLESNKSPSRKVNEIDNRGSHVYLAMYWAQAMATQQKNPELSERFARMYAQLYESDAVIVEELLAVQGAAVDVGGYYAPNGDLASAAMRPSGTFNKILASL